MTTQSHPHQTLTAPPWAGHRASRAAGRLEVIKVAQKSSLPSAMNNAYQRVISDPRGAYTGGERRYSAPACATVRALACNSGTRTLQSMAI